MVESMRLSWKENFRSRRDTLAFFLVLPVILAMFHFYIFSLWFYWDLAPEIPLILSTAILFVCYRRLEWYIPIQFGDHTEHKTVRPVRWFEVVVWYLVAGFLFWHLTQHFDFWSELKAGYFKVLLWGYVAVIIILLTLGTLADYLVSFVAGFIDRLQGVPMLLDRVFSIFMVYVGVASLFAAAYRYLSLWSEGAFNAPIESTLDAFYFSVVTMTTLGYGDIHPVSAVAKVMVVAEVLSGVMLLAMMVGVAISVSFYEIDHEDW